MAPMTLDHVALQAELLAHQIRDVPFMSNEDIVELHRMLARCLLFLNPNTP